MREYIYTNLKIIKSNLKIRTKKVSRLNRLSIMEEFKEWSQDPYLREESIWTLPDLTRIERFKNFCRSIRKEIK